MQHEHNKGYIRSYKRWLNGISKLNDFAWRDEEGVWKQLTDAQLAEFKNKPKLSYLEKDVEGLRWPLKVYRNAYVPRYAEFGSHLTKEAGFTIFARNKASSVLLMLVDLDNKDGSGDVDAAVAHLLKTYGFSSSYVEPSTHFLGRHVYFLLDTSVAGMTFKNRKDVWETLKKFEGLIAADKIWEETGVVFDGFFGKPTLWEKRYGELVVSLRGNALKLPRALRGEADLALLEALTPMSLDRLHVRLNGIVTLRTDSVIEVSVPKSSRLKLKFLDIENLSGFEKKKHCVSRLLIASNGKTSLEAVMEDYLSNWKPTTQGDTPKQINKRKRDLATIFKNMRRRFKPKEDKRKYPFRRDQFLSQIQDLNIHEDQFRWARREKLTLQRLSDFVSLKVADAFYVGKGTSKFARTARDTSINNSRTLKEQGKLDWILNGHTYKRYLEIACKFNLLAIEQSHRPPIIDCQTNAKISRGEARLIGPGTALKAARDEWLPFYEIWRAAAMGPLQDDLTTLGAVTSEEWKPTPRPAITAVASGHVH